MSFTLEPGTPLADYYAAIQPQIGSITRHDLGVLDDVTIGRYALTVGTPDKIHSDRRAALAAGYADVVAPSNMLSAIFEWGIGTPETLLNSDGTPAIAIQEMGDRPALRAMGAGEEMELVTPAVAGMHLLLETATDSVVAKDTRRGPCVFVTTSHNFLTSEGVVLNRNKRTIVLRNPHQEP